MWLQLSMCWTVPSAISLHFGLFPLLFVGFRIQGGFVGEGGHPEELQSMTGAGVAFRRLQILSSSWIACIRAGCTYNLLVVDFSHFHFAFLKMWVPFFSFSCPGISHCFLFLALTCHIPWRLITDLFGQLWQWLQGVGHILSKVSSCRWGEHRRILSKELKTFMVYCFLGKRQVCFPTIMQRAGL